MLPFLRKHHSLLFFLAWFTINIIQAGFTELIDDEAYYWVYSQFPAWGYYDHPPLIAILIKTGYFFFQHETGVRLLPVMLNTATIFIIRSLVPSRNDILFYAIACSMLVAQIGGVLAAPDSPLIFSVALFFLFYKRFSEKATVGNALLLGLSMALMLYSKYHGVLIIFFTLLSNLKLFRHYQTWVAGFFTLLLFLPHLYWQYTHDFPSVRYHLFERNASTYRISYTIEYLLGQIALAGPLMGWLLLWAAAQFKPVSGVEKALKFSLAGIYAFFLLMSFKGRVEANWTIPAFIPIMILGHGFLKRAPAQQHWLIKMVPITLVMMVLVRLYLLSFIPASGWFHKADEVHGNITWVKAVEQKSAGNPVVFLNSYQLASKYWFYSNRPGLSLNGIDYRRNNFNFWPVEDSLLGKKVLFVSRFNQVENISADTISHAMELVSCMSDTFYSFSRIAINTIAGPVLKDGVFKAECRISSPVNYLPFFREAIPGSYSLVLGFYTDQAKPVYIKLPCSLQQIHAAEQTLTIEAPVKLPPNKYLARIGIATSIPDVYTLNSAGFLIDIE